MNFFERIDKFDAYIWRADEDGKVERYSRGTTWWEEAEPDFDLDDPKVSRPIGIERVKFLKGN